MSVKHKPSIESELVEKVARLFVCDGFEILEPDRKLARAAIAVVVGAVDGYADELLTAYRKKWAESPYFGPAEKTPTELEQIVKGFIKDFAIEYAIPLNPKER